VWKFVDFVQRPNRLKLLLLLTVAGIRPRKNAFGQGNQMAEALSGFRSVLRISAPAGIYQMILDVGSNAGDLLMKFQETARPGGPPGLQQAAGGR